VTDGPADPRDVTTPRPRRIGAVNWLGLWTHYEKELLRFLKIGFQTLAAPVVVTLLYLAVFSLALGRAVEAIAGIPFDQYLAPGLVMMSVIQNAFANSSSSIMMSKVQGNIVDVLMPPLSAGELALGFVMGGVTRGLIVATVVALALALFVPMRVHDLAAIVFFAASAAFALSALGVIIGLWASKWDHVASITNFIIIPLSFLSGTFYSIERLPEPFLALAHLNPFFYMIDGLRYGFLGHVDGSLAVGAIAITLVNAALWTGCLRLFAIGYKIKA
jgi:ABC-2 type transport system permease protein